MSDKMPQYSDDKQDIPTTENIGDIGDIGNIDDPKDKKQLRKGVLGGISDIFVRVGLEVSRKRRNKLSSFEKRIYLSGLLLT